MNSKFPASIAAKVVAITKEIGRVEADGRNQHSGYKYISYEQVNARLRNLLSEHKLAIMPEVLDYVEKDYVVGERTIIRTIVNLKITLVDTETGESVEQSWIGADQDTGGKSFGKAITEAVKRFELKLFHISTKEDIDPDQVTVEAERPDPISFISMNPRLKAICAEKRLVRKAIEKAVIDGSYNVEKIEEILSTL